VGARGAGLVELQEILIEDTHWYIEFFTRKVPPGCFQIFRLSRHCEYNLINIAELERNNSVPIFVWG
jgi:hypothetical protein